MQLRPTVIAVILLTLPSSIPAIAQSFHEDFDGTELDNSIWLVEPGDGEIVVANGVATVTATGTTFPVATTKQDPFPPGDFLLRVGLRYLTVARCGAGFGAVDGFFPGQGCSPFKLWQDAAGWYVYSGSLGFQLLTPHPQYEYHVYEWLYVNGEYSFTLDGVPIMSGGCAPRATSFFFGHVHPISCSGGWTSFEIDFVHIEPFGPVQSKTETWGRIKAERR